MDMHLGPALRIARLKKSLSQQAVADRAQLTQGHVSLIERGMDVHLSVLQKLARAVGLRVALAPVLPELVEAPYGEDEIANRMYLLARLAATRVSEGTLSRMQTWLERAVEQHGERSYFRAWQEACERGPEPVVAILTDATEFGRYMRAVASVRPFVTKGERDAFYRPTVPPELIT